MSQFESSAASFIVGAAVLPVVGAAALALAAAAAGATVVVGGALAIGSFLKDCHDLALTNGGAVALVPRSITLAHQIPTALTTMAQLQVTAPQLAAAIRTYAPDEVDLRNAARRAVAELGRDEVAVSSAAFELALADMGFHVTARTSAAGHRDVRAVSEAAHVAVRIGRDSIDIDTARCEGDACVPLIAELHRRVEGYGLRIDPRKVRKSRVGPAGGPLFNPPALTSDVRDRDRGDQRGDQRDGRETA